MLGIIQRASANFKNTATPAGWSPQDDVPSGFSAHQSRLAVPLSTLGSFAFRSTGSYSRGTLVFERATDGHSAASAGFGGPPGYDAHADDKPRKEGMVDVAVEVRTNSDGMRGDCRLETIEGHERAGLSLTTPSSTSVTRIGASLSYHITVTLPSTFTSLDTLSVETTGFRVILAPSLSSIDITSLAILTTDAPIVLSSTRCGTASLKNQNLLDPNKHALKNFDDLVQGSLSAQGRIDIQCENGPISGAYTTPGALVVATTNFSVKGEFKGATVRISTQNAEVSGRFDARRDIVVVTQHGKVEGVFRAPAGCEVKGQYVGVKGEFDVGSHLRLLTSVFRIDATIRLLSPALSTTSPAGAAPVTRTLSNATSSTAADLPPTFEDALASSSASGAALGVVTVQAETTDAGVELVFPEAVPSDCALRATARSSGGSRVAVTHARGWEGRFSASTTITHTASLSSLANASSPIHYDTQKRSEVAGFVGSGAGAGAGDGRNRTHVESDGPVEIVLL
ncbi:hypothetical protein JCM3775_007176 [Rhodotorula graminis]